MGEDTVQDQEKISSAGENICCAQVTDRCSSCGATRERYTESELSLALVVLNTFVHRDPQVGGRVLVSI